MSRLGYRCPECGKTAMWGKPTDWKGYPKGELILWCHNCDAIVGGEKHANPFADERAI